jgi:hypothetical protein
MAIAHAASASMPPQMAIAHAASASMPSNLPLLLPLVLVLVLLLLLLLLLPLQPHLCIAKANRIKEGTCFQHVIHAACVAQ